MLDKLKKHPWTAAITAFFIYVAWFIVPVIIVKIKNAGAAQAAAAAPATEIEQMISELPNQIGLVVLVLGIVALLGWWKQVGFRKPHSKSLRFMIPPLLYIGLLLSVGTISGKSGGTGFLGTSSSKELILVALTTFLVGLTEETMFRGIIFHGATARFKTILGTIISSLIFGLLHFMNMLGGAGFGWTVSQVIHAASDGFMYAALRLVTGSLWPGIILHGLWDLSVSYVHTAVKAGGGAAAQNLTNLQVGGIHISPLQVLPGVLYGAYVLWRWSKREK